MRSSASTLGRREFGISGVSRGGWSMVGGRSVSLDAGGFRRGISMDGGDGVVKVNWSLLGRMVVSVGVTAWLISEQKPFRETVYCVPIGSLWHFADLWMNSKMQIHAEDVDVTDLSYRQPSMTLEEKKLAYGIIKRLSHLEPRMVERSELNMELEGEIALGGDGLCVAVKDQQVMRIKELMQLCGHCFSHAHLSEELTEEEIEAGVLGRSDPRRTSFFDDPLVAYLKRQFFSDPLEASFVRYRLQWLKDMSKKLNNLEHPCDKDAMMKEIHKNVPFYRDEEGEIHPVYNPWTDLKPLRAHLLPQKLPAYGFASQPELNEVEYKAFGRVWQRVATEFDKNKSRRETFLLNVPNMIAFLYRYGEGCEQRRKNCEALQAVEGSRFREELLLQEFRQKQLEAWAAMDYDTMIKEIYGVHEQMRRELRAGHPVKKEHRFRVIGGEERDESSGQLVGSRIDVSLRLPEKKLELPTVDWHMNGE